MTDLGQIKMRIAELRMDLDRLDETRDQVSGLIEKLESRKKDLEYQRLKPRPLVTMTMED